MSDEVLQQGSSGDDVIELQTQLQQLNFYAGSVDGYFGPTTEAAVGAYREWGGLGYGVEADEQVRSALAGHVQQYSQPDDGGAGQDGYDTQQWGDGGQAADAGDGAAQDGYGEQWADGYAADGAQAADAGNGHAADGAQAVHAGGGADAAATPNQPKATKPVANNEIDGADTEEAPAPELDEFAGSQ